MGIGDDSMKAWGEALDPAGDQGVSDCSDLSNCYPR